jgi:hypothetical protein
LTSGFFEGDNFYYSLKKDSLNYFLLSQCNKHSLEKEVKAKPLNGARLTMKVIRRNASFLTNENQILNKEIHVYEQQ